MINKQQYLNTFLLLVVIAALAYMLVGPPRAAITIAPVPSAGDFLEDEPKFLLAGQRDAPLVLVIPKGQRLPLQCEDRTEDLNLVIQDGSSGNRGYVNCAPGGETPTPAPTGQPTPTAEATGTAVATPEPEITSTPTNIPSATETPAATATDVSGEPIPPFVGASPCEDIGIAHPGNTWHGAWNYDNGCKWDHDHKADLHAADDIFGTELFEIIGGDLSPAWQTFAGANDSSEEYIEDTCTEDGCKHEGYGGFLILNRGEPADRDDTLLLNRTAFIVHGRGVYHAVGGAVGAHTRFHSLTYEGVSCLADVTLELGPDGETNGRTINGEFVPITRFTIDEFPGCGYWQQGGWLDFGRLNYPRRGEHAPLGNDTNLVGCLGASPVEAAPYRIHATGQNSLDSWQSEGNVCNYLASDPNGDFRLQMGIGLHFPQGESPGETVPSDPTSVPLWCVDDQGFFTCDNDFSAAAPFRLWVTVPDAVDGSRFDEDGQANGFFTFHGHTSRYGDIVEGCAEAGLDCVPTTYESMPVTRSGYRGSATEDCYDSMMVGGGDGTCNGPDDLLPAGERALKYPN
jgi:hypothetical protein